MVDGVKSCSEVQQDEDAEMTRVFREDDVIGVFEEGSFSVL